MRTLCSHELLAVGGGTAGSSGGSTPLNSAIARGCAGQPDSRNVTVTVSTTAGIGVMTQTVETEVEVNCGDWRKQQGRSG